MNKHEQIADNRRIQLRKMLSELGKWCSTQSCINQIDTEKSIGELKANVQHIEDELNRLD